MKVDVRIDGETAVITSDRFKSIQFTSSSSVSSPVMDFALWAILPIAMRVGGEVECNFPVSKNSLGSARKIASIWAGWCPEIYSVPDLRIEQIEDSENVGGKSLTFFSGGVDSTYTALKLKEEGISTDSLTVHGMDFRYYDKTKFQAFLDQTLEFRAASFEQSILVRTNVYDIYNSLRCNPLDGHVTHIFALVASACLFSAYQNYFIAADYRLDQQYAVHPYGSNTSTNRLIHTSTGRLLTRDDDVTRSYKTKYIYNSGMELDSLTICKDYNVRPKNCGVCSKCIRTKVMFYVTTGKVPNIFLDASVPTRWYESIRVGRKIDLVYMADILDAIRQESRQEELHFDSAYQLWRDAALSGRASSPKSVSVQKTSGPFSPKLISKIIKRTFR